MGVVKGERRQSEGQAGVDEEVVQGVAGFGWRSGNNEGGEGGAWRSTKAKVESLFFVE